MCYVRTLSYHCFKVYSQVLIYRYITYGAAITVAESESDFRNTTDTYSSPSWAKYGVSIGRILEKTDRVIAAPHCICWLAHISYWGAQNTRLSAPIEISLNNTNLFILSRALQLCKYPMMQIGLVDLIWQPTGTRFTENNMLKVSIAR